MTPAGRRRGRQRRRRRRRPLRRKYTVRPVIGNPAAVLHRLTRIPSPSLVRRLPVRGLDEAAPVVLVVRRSSPVALVRLLELGRRRRRPGVGLEPRRRRVLPGRGGGGRGTRRNAIDTNEPLGVIQEREHAMVVPEFALDLLRHSIGGGWVHLETTTFVNMLCITSFQLHTSLWSRYEINGSTYNSVLGLYFYVTQ